MKHRCLYLILLCLFAVHEVMAQTGDNHVSPGMRPDVLPKQLRPDRPNPHPSPLFERLVMAETSSATSHVADTTHQVILLIGDSMTDGLGHILADYAAENNHELHTVVWYGSRSDHWALRGDLEYHIRRVHPTFIIFVLGTNDLGFYDYSKREQWIQTIIHKIGDIPFVWIGPLPWSKIRDRGIVNVIRNNVGEKRFFDSSDIRCPRIDGIHPTLAGAKAWCKKIVEWLGNPETTLHPIPMRAPTRTVRYVADEKHTPKYKGRPAAL